MIIWSGLGFLTLLITWGCLIGAEVLIEDWYRDERYYQSHGWPKLAGFLIAASIVWFVGKFLNRRGARLLVDPQTGEKVVLDADRHSFFFIPMQWWAPILAVLAVVFCFVGVEKPAAAPNAAGAAEPPAHVEGAAAGSKKNTPGPR